MPAEEVSKGGPQQRCSGCPRSALEHAVIAIKPEFGVLGIWKRFKSAISIEGISSPFPDIPCHIETSVITRSVGLDSDRRCRPMPHTEIGQIVIRKLVSPGKAPFQSPSGIPGGRF